MGPKAQKRKEEKKKLFNQKLKNVRTEKKDRVLGKNTVSLLEEKKSQNYKKKAQIVFKRPFHLLLQCMETEEK